MTQFITLQQKTPEDTVSDALIFSTTEIQDYTEWGTIKLGRQGVPETPITNRCTHQDGIADVASDGVYFLSFFSEEKA